MPRHVQRLDKEVEYLFTNGHCAAFAVELHRKYGWALKVIYPGDPEVYFHALAERPDGKLVDVLGVWEPHEQEFVDIWGGMSGPDEGHLNPDRFEQDGKCGGEDWCDVQHCRPAKEMAQQAIAFLGDSLLAGGETTSETVSNGDESR